MGHRLYQHAGIQNIPTKVWGADTAEDFQKMMENKEKYDGFMNMIIILDTLDIYVCNSKGEWSLVGGGKGGEF